MSGLQMIMQQGNQAVMLGKPQYFIPSEALPEQRAEPLLAGGIQAGSGAAKQQLKFKRRSGKSGFAAFHRTKEYLQDSCQIAMPVSPAAGRV